MGVVLAAVASMLAVVVGLNVGGLRERLWGGAGSPHIDSIAVLPLDNLMGDTEQEYFVEGMHEALTAELSKISALKVISRTSAMRYQDTDKPMPQIARELGVEALIEGSVLREGNQVRITVQLIHGATDEHLWAGAYERDLTNILVLQREVAQAIAREINIALTPEEQARLASARPVNPEAHEAYLKGRYHWNKRTARDLLKATEYFHAATELDPNYALAYAGLADSYALYSFYGVLSARESFPQARAAASRALEIDDTLVEAHTAIAFVTLYYDWDWAAAEIQLKRVLELRPDYAIARQWYAEYLSAMGRHEAAIREIKRAQEFDPLSLIMKSQEGAFYYFAGRYEQAIEACERALSLDPNFAFAYLALARAYEAKGMYREAMDAFRRATELSGGQTRDSLAIAHLYAQSGRPREARKVLDQILSTRPEAQRLGSPYIAMVHAALGENDEAMVWLEKAYQEHHVRLFLLKVDPRYDPLRDDPRFQDLLRRMNFPAN
ncbi:MAG: tetratricopeptide repeat protein [Acidiferrobacterales bacterium]